MNRNLLSQVEYRIREDSVPPDDKHYGGAGLIITHDVGHSYVEGKVLVVSSFAGEISWVVERMKEVFADQINSLNKFSFYPEMGRAALAAIAAGGSRQEILRAIVAGAKDFWSNRPLFIETDFEKALELLRSPAYFAYGSNLSHKQMDERCPGAVFVGAGLVTGYRFLINKRGFATITPDGDSAVYGGIYLLTDAHIASLDGHEGVDAGSYEKTTIAATATENPEALECLVYIDPRTDPGFPNMGYLEKILHGAQECGLPSAYISFLKSFANPPL